ncbi:MAG: amidohydrolase family protein, partial [Actinomycetota bacterium]|nr:amidohydrolase family protein [Actinomycetota bacterium]
VSGRVVLPGLVDAHVHLSSDLSRSPGFGPAKELKGEDPRPSELRWFVLAASSRAFLEAGFTTVRDVGAFDDEAIVMRRAVDLDLVPGPRIRTCGRIVSATAPGGRIFGTMYEQADGPWPVRRAVRAQLQRGADFIKMMATGARSVEREDTESPQFTREEMEAIVDEAHRNGLRVAAHAEGLEGTRMAIESGADTIEHGLALHRAPDLLAAMAERGQVLVPTLSTFHDLAERFTTEWVPRLVDQAKRQLEEAYLTLVAADKAGVTMAMGFDSGPPGADAWELVRMAEGGLGSMPALAAATSGGTAALGVPELGRLQTNAIADLIVVDGDPVKNVRDLLDRNRIRLVIQNGAVVAGRDLDGPVIGNSEAAPDQPIDPLGFD